MNKNYDKKQILSTYVLGIVIFAALFLFDKWTKVFASTSLKGSEPRIVVDGVFELTYLENTGAAFSMLEGARGFFLIITVVVVAILIYLYIKIPPVKRFFLIHLAIVLVITGAIGNFIDRLRNGFVVDFLYFSLIDFPVFNVADCCVTAGAILAGVLIIFVYKENDFEMIFPKKKQSDGV